MNKLLAGSCCLLLSAFAACLSAQETEQHQSVESRLPAISNAISEVMKLYDIPAVSTCVISDDEVHFINVGHASRRADKRVDENSIYQIASLSKTFVGIVAHKLAANKTIKLDDSITVHLPDQLESESKQRLQQVSVRDLLQHRSGLPRDTLNPNARRGGTYVNYAYSETDLLEDLELMELNFVPGEEFSYSNYAYALLGYMLERASGKNYEQLVDEHVTQCFDMSDTGFDITSDQQKRLVTPYNMENPRVGREPASIGKLGPPTSIYSSTADLAKLMKSQLAEYRKFQKTKDVTPLVLTHDSKEAWQGSGISYGYGFLDWGNGTYGHGGGMDGYGSEYTFNPQENFGFILLTSSCGQWSSRLTIAVSKILSGAELDILSELVALETILAAAESQGVQAALDAYKKIHARDPSLLGKEARKTLINLAKQNGLTEVAETLIQDAISMEQSGSAKQGDS